MGIVPDYNNSMGIVPDYNNSKGIVPDYNNRVVIVPDYNNSKVIVPDYNNSKGIVPDHNNSKGIVPDYNNSMGIVPDYMTYTCILFRCNQTYHNMLSIIHVVNPKITDQRKPLTCKTNNLTILQLYVPLFYTVNLISVFYCSFFNLYQNELVITKLDYQELFAGVKNRLLPICKKMSCVLKYHFSRAYLLINLTN